MQLAAAADAEGIGGVGLLHAEGNVGLQLAHQAGAQVAGGDVGALAAGERAVVDGEGHGDGRLGDLDEGQRLDGIRRADGVADHNVLNARDGDDLAHAGAFHRHALEPLERKQAAQAEVLVEIGVEVVAAGRHAVELERAAGDAADADSADKVVVVDGGDQHLHRRVRVALRRGDVLEDGFKQRAQVFARHIRVERRGAGAGAGVDDRGIELAFVRAEVDHQVEGLVVDLLAARVRAVHLVDDDDDRQAERQRVLEHEAGLRHRAFKRVDEQQNAVHHLEHALDLAAEIGVAGGIDDVDLHVLIVHGGILRQNGDAALLLDGVIVHHAVGNLLVFAENAALLEHLVDERGLAVVNVRDDGDIAEVFTNHFQMEALLSVDMSVLCQWGECQPKRDAVSASSSPSLFSSAQRIDHSFSKRITSRSRASLARDEVLESFKSSMAFGDLVIQRTKR